VEEEERRSRRPLESGFAPLRIDFLAGRAGCFCFFMVALNNTRQEALSDARA
jgi:hypothetical protein